MQAIDSIRSVADQFDAIVFDQWGVLHDGSAPYPTAVSTIKALNAGGHQLAVLSNSGKRADINHTRITNMGFPPDVFAHVMTSGEALWHDFQAGVLEGVASVYPITAASGDAERWRGTLPVTLTDTHGTADAILLMGLPDGADHADTRALMDQARAAGKLVLCSNPDRASPRAGGNTVTSPGALAHAYHDAGGNVRFYGKPHRPIFEALARALNLNDPARILMVGDSPEHDIQGAHSAGWKSLFISGGLHADASDPLADLFQTHPSPDFTLDLLR